MVRINGLTFENTVKSRVYFKQLKSNKNIKIILLFQKLRSVSQFTDVSSIIIVTFVLDMITKYY